MVLTYCDCDGVLWGGADLLWLWRGALGWCWLTMTVVGCCRVTLTCYRAVTGWCRFIAALRWCWLAAGLHGVLWGNVLTYCRTVMGVVGWCWFTVGLWWGGAELWGVLKWCGQTVRRDGADFFRTVMGYFGMVLTCYSFVCVFFFFRRGGGGGLVWYRNVMVYFKVVLTHCRTVMGTVNVHFGVTLIHCRTVMVYFGMGLTHCRTVMGYFLVHVDSL